MSFFPRISNWIVQTWIRCTNLHSFSLGRKIDQIWRQKITIFYNFTKTCHTFTIILDTLACFYCKSVHYRFVNCIRILYIDTNFRLRNVLIWFYRNFFIFITQTINSLWFRRINWFGFSFIFGRRNFSLGVVIHKIRRFFFQELIGIRYLLRIYYSIIYLFLNRKIQLM